MIYENVQLHNVAETQSVGGGARLQRVPEEVRTQLNEAAQMRVLQPDNCEIRFVSDSVESHVTLSSEGETDVTIFYGTFDGRERHTIGRQPTTLCIRPQDRLQKLDRRWWGDQPRAHHRSASHLAGRTLQTSFRVGGGPAAQIGD